MRCAVCFPGLSIDEIMVYAVPSLVFETIELGPKLVSDVWEEIAEERDAVVGFAFLSE